MKRIERKEIVQTVIKSVVTQKVCDICGEDYTNDKSGEVTIRCVTGEVWPEGDCRTSEEFDVCHDCFVFKVVPMMNKLGANPINRSMDEIREWQDA